MRKSTSSRIFNLLSAVFWFFLRRPPLTELERVLSGFWADRRVPKTPKTDKNFPPHFPKAINEIGSLLVVIESRIFATRNFDWRLGNGRRPIIFSEFRIHEVKKNNNITTPLSFFIIADWRSSRNSLQRLFMYPIHKVQISKLPPDIRKKKLGRDSPWINGRPESSILGHFEAVKGPTAKISPGLINESI